MPPRSISIRARAGRTIAGLWTLVVLGCLDGQAAEQGNTAEAAFFENRIRPLLAEFCYECHGGIAREPKGGLRLDTADGVRRGGKSGTWIHSKSPTETTLIQRVRNPDPKERMPRSEGGSKPLPESALNDLERWVSMGSPFPDAVPAVAAKRSAIPTTHWAFQSVSPIAIPTVTNRSWVQNSIDPFILARIEAKGGQPAPAADRRTLLRRATFDLTGLPPTAEEVDRFIADTSPDAFDRVVERLLASPHYGERWGRHWLDVARYADTAGDTADYPVPVAWRYRNYVIDAFNADKPYDEFVREQLAGDILARQGPPEQYAERVTASGYLAVSRRFGFDSENYHHLTIQDTIDTLGQSLLGLSLGCARCHDHKYDPVSSVEYYGLYGIFESTRYPFPGSEQKARYRALVPLVPAAESQRVLRAMDERFAYLGSPPAGVLRSLDDMDGDFEMQKPAAGGSKGALVPPWNFEGPVSVTTEAQSPFKNVHAFGTVGASLAAGTLPYRMDQALHPLKRSGKLFLNLDFRIATNQPQATGTHRLWLGRQRRGEVPPLFELRAGIRGVVFPASGKTIDFPQPGQWQNLQIALDPDRRTFEGSLGAPGAQVRFEGLALGATPDSEVDFLSMESGTITGTGLPGIEIDNIAVREAPFLPVSITVAGVKTTKAAELDALKTELKRLTNAAAPSTMELKRRVDALAAEVEQARRQFSGVLDEGPLEFAYAVSEGTPRDTRQQIRGEPEKLGREVRRGFLGLAGGGALEPTAAGSGRLELAQWITDPANPLTARVMVNRIWQYHFGQGLVATPNDFGVRGRKPSHPDLLDHLALRFVQQRWSIKAMHRLILLSATYQQAAGDGNELYAAFPRRRLSAEEIRDSILAVSGEWDRTPGRGHPFPAPTSWGYTQHNPFSAVYDHNKRSVYLMTQRLKRHPFLALFDGADPNGSTAVRSQTTVPTQALYFLNDPFVHSKAERLGRAMAGAAPADAARVTWVFRQAYGRSPTDSEIQAGEVFLRRYRSAAERDAVPAVDTAACAAYVRVLFGSNEFLCVD